MIPYRFMPVVRRGLARAHQVDDDNTALPARASIGVGLTLQAKRDGTAVAAVSGNINLQLYGPGDIVGIDPRLIVRTDPKPHATNFEPNYLAIVDFDPPDFPWLLTPAKANSQENLRPWLILIVVERRESTVPRIQPGRPLPSIALTVKELPDLSESWLFAHAQAVSVEQDAERLAAELEQLPERNISRLVCPRRLEARRSYVACVVPAFDVGRLRGLAQPVPDAGTLAPAWVHAAPADMEVELPVYFHWEFSTGPVGDIETLARRLRTPDKYKDDRDLLAQLNQIGELKVAVDDDHLLFDGDEADETVFEGALVSLGFKPKPPNATFAKRLEGMLNSGQARATEATPAEAAKVPTLSPPIYGEHPSKRHTVDRTHTADRWLDQLNLQPRYRLAAGWGAEVVRTFQDEFMQAAWTQVGDVLAAERAFSLARFACDVLKAIERRHLTKLPEDRLLAVIAPARARVKVGPGETLFGRIANATLPDELFGGAMRRFATDRRPTLRMARWRARDRAIEPVAVRMRALVDMFAAADRHLDAIDPNRFVPDGIVGNRVLEAIPLPDNADQMVDLFPHLGLRVEMSAGEIRRINEAAQTARDRAAGMRRALPKMGDIGRQGILTETHQLRMAELQRSSLVRISDVEIEKVMKQASRGDAEGVLLSVTDEGRVVAQPLRIDQEGTVRLAGRNIAARAEARATVLRPARLAVVPQNALRLHGNRAVFARLPAGALGRAAPVEFRVDRARRFNPINLAIEGEGLGERVVSTITMPPTVKERAVLERYAAAFESFAAQYVDPLREADIEVRAVPFAVGSAALGLKARIKPEVTVPQRLASTLALGGNAVTWNAGEGMRDAFISVRLDLALQDGLRYLVPVTFDRIMACPHLRLPISRKLEAIVPDVFLPGVGVLPDDFIMAVKTNPRFVEALMLGANHEMNRELLWQGFPTDQRGTPFQHFWQRLDGATDIEPVHQWAQAPLGDQPGSGEMLVLLIRGQLLERFPNLSIYAYPKGAADGRPGQNDPPAPGVPGEMAATKIELPILRGHLGRDITYVGFNIKPDAIEQHFFILEEHLTEPRFGFDEPDGEGQDSELWLDVDWNDVAVDSGTFFGAANLRRAQPAGGAHAAAWTHPHAAMVADALLQRPFRGFYTGVKLKMPPSE